jgi:hypothetical protein
MIYFYFYPFLNVIMIESLGSVKPVKSVVIISKPKDIEKIEIIIALTSIFS